MEAGPAGGTRTETDTSPPKEAVENDFMLSFCESLGNGSGAGVDLLDEHWHTPPCELVPPLQQHDPLAPQQLPPCAEGTALSPQHECRGRDPAAQRGHLASGAASTRTGLTSLERGAWSPQAQAVMGRDCTGNDMAASHTRTFAVMVLHSLITSARHFAVSKAAAHFNLPV